MGSEVQFLFIQMHDSTSNPMNTIEWHSCPTQKAIGFDNEIHFPMIKTSEIITLIGTINSALCTLYKILAVFHHDSWIWWIRTVHNCWIVHPVSYWNWDHGVWYVMLEISFTEFIQLLQLKFCQLSFSPKYLFSLVYLSNVPFIDEYSSALGNVWVSKWVHYRFGCDHKELKPISFWMGFFVMVLLSN